MFDISTGKWSTKKPYPYWGRPYAVGFNKYAIIAHREKFILFGGETSHLYKKKVTTIASFDPIENNWKYIGDLSEARIYLNVVQTNEKFWIIGGYGRSWKSLFERCELGSHKYWPFYYHPQSFRDYFYCETVWDTPKLVTIPKPKSDEQFYPNILKVNSNFGQICKSAQNSSLGSN